MKEVFKKNDFNRFNNEIVLNVEILNKKNKKVIKYPFFFKIEIQKEIELNDIVNQLKNDGFREMLFKSKNFDDIDFSEEKATYTREPIDLGINKKHIVEYSYLIKITNPKSDEILYTEF